MLPDSEGARINSTSSQVFLIQTNFSLYLTLGFLYNEETCKQINPLLGDSFLLLRPPHRLQDLPQSSEWSQNVLRTISKPESLNSTVILKKFNEIGHVTHLSKVEFKKAKGYHIYCNLLFFSIKLMHTFCKKDLHNLYTI